MGFVFILVVAVDLRATVLFGWPGQLVVRVREANRRSSEILA
jgi:hypothetical protein